MTTETKLSIEARLCAFAIVAIKTMHGKQGLASECIEVCDVLHWAGLRAELGQQFAGSFVMNDEVLKYAARVDGSEQDANRAEFIAFLRHGKATVPPISAGEVL